MGVDYGISLIIGNAGFISSTIVVVNIQMSLYILEASSGNFAMRKHDEGWVEGLVWVLGFRV